MRRATAVLAVGAPVGACGFAAVKVIRGESLNQVTSDRMERVEDTARVIERNPLVGRRDRRPAPVRAGGCRGRDRPTPTFVSHTTPLTVAAELGAIGLALYCWLLLGACA